MSLKELEGLLGKVASETSTAPRLVSPYDLLTFRYWRDGDRVLIVAFDGDQVDYWLWIVY
jgi:hypothetical protein